MNKILIALMMCFAVSVFADDEYYVWADGQSATNALAFINTHGWFPVIGRNLKTGKKEFNRSTAQRWTDKVLVRTDGKFCFRRVPTDLLDALGISVEQRIQFLQAFKPEIEVWEESWFEVKE